MIRPAALFLLALVTACAGTLYSTLQGSTSKTPPDAYDCVRNQLKEMGYRQMQYDISDRWVLSQKVDTTAHVSSGLYRRTLNKLEVRVEPDASGDSRIAIKARSFDEYTNAEGAYLDERRATDVVMQDAAELIKGCGTP